jgi:PAS domain-containing protein
MGQDSSIRRDVGTLLVAAVLLFGVAATGLHSYLLFHSLGEAFSVIVACGVFMVVWNARRVLENNYLLFVGIGLLCVAVLDLFHALAYRGMGVFSADAGNLAAQLWLQARYVQALSLVIAPFLIGRSLRPNLVLGAYALVLAALLASVFAFHVFPTCMTPEGLTPFKNASEYAISLLFAGAMALLLLNWQGFDRHVLALLACSIGFTLASELVFAFGLGGNTTGNMLGHLFKIIAFYLIYKAVIETSMVRPHDVLFRDLQQSERALRASELHFRRMVDESPGGVVVASRDGVVQYVNPAAEALFGRPARDLVGEPFGHPLQPGKAIALDITRPSGQTIIAGMHVVETQWEGHPSYLASLHDITEHRR